MFKEKLHLLKCFGTINIVIIFCILSMTPVSFAGTNDTTYSLQAIKEQLVQMENQRKAEIERFKKLEEQRSAEMAELQRRLQMLESKNEKLEESVKESAQTVKESNPKVIVNIAKEDGWEVSFDGMINVFGMWQTGDDRPSGTNVAVDTLGGAEEDSWRLRSGFLPAILALNVKSPPIGSLKMGARVGFYPNVQNANTKNSFNSQIDLREAYGTIESADSDYGQLLVGKALSLFLQSNTLTEMSLLGVGVQGGVSSGGTSLGRIGYGYVYSQFNVQARYTTPEINGCKLALAVYDPSIIQGQGISATKTTTPRVEFEMSYEGDVNDFHIKTWGNGLYQNAKFTGAQDGSVDAWGLGGGLQVGYNGFTIMGSGFTGEALGMSLMLDTDSLDPVGEERDIYGFIVQGTYEFDNALGHTKIGLNYGQNTVDETSYEKDVRHGGGVAEIEEQSSWLFGIYHDINPYFKIVTEYSHAKNEWFNSEDRDADLISLGTIWSW